ncbi:hypothetical protein MS_045 [Vibrio phage VPMS1]|nr:hypothetical protein MS_045 [Vibrio phage VPMS1]AFV51124.1 hypothetical protein MS_045 [Vibrio phage VPMS1]
MITGAALLLICLRALWVDYSWPSLMLVVILFIATIFGV